MYNTVDEGLNQFFLALATFKSLVERFGLTQGKSRNPIWHPDLWEPWIPNHNPGGLASKDNDEVERQAIMLKGMAVALGLTESEVRTYYARAGLPTTPTPDDLQQTTVVRGGRGTPFVADRYLD